MEINVREGQKLVEIWLTKAEKGDAPLRERLKPLYAAYKKKNYLVAVYESGERSLYRGTLDLLSYNKRRVEELALRREKGDNQGEASPGSQDGSSVKRFLR